MVVLSPPVDADLLRLRGEFDSLPGLGLTVAQAARLLAVREVRARRLLDTLAAEGFVIRTVSGIYRRVSPLTVYRSPAT